MENIGDLRAEAFRELAKLAPARTSALALTDSEFAWLKEFVKMAEEGPILELHTALAGRVGIKQTTSEKIAIRLRAKGMLPDLLPNGKAVWQPTRRALRTVASSLSGSLPTSDAS